ncbi:MAG: conjugal transfer protein TraH [Candidatus Manganitrophaceae bacterium]
MFTKSIVLLAMMFIPISTQAGWVDDWLDQKTETSPGYFEGQKRGFVTGGGFSARWYQSNDYLATVTPPRIKSGCGGIDVFMGGFSFLNADFLVQKYQNMLMNAPAVAFDIAFNTLCEPCTKAMKSLEAASSFLNQLQFNDCQASQVLVAKALDPFTDNPKIAAMAESDFELTSGARTLRKELTDIWKGNGNTPTRSTSAQIAACPAPMRAIFGTPGKTVLLALGEAKGYPASYINLARGFVGDVEIRDVGPPTAPRIVPLFIPPCEKNKPETVENFFSGEVYERPANGGACVSSTDVNRNMVQWVSTRMNRITTMMRNSTPILPGSDEEAFINTLPLPIYRALKTAVLENQEGAIIALYAGLTARAYAFGAMSDLYNLILQNLRLSKSIVSRQGGETTTGCQMELLLPAIKATEELSENGQAMLGHLQTAYAALASEINTISQIAQRMKEFDRISEETMSAAFSPAR